MPPAFCTTVQQLIDGYTSLQVDKLAATLANDFEHVVLPKSIGMPTHTQQRFKVHAAGIFAVFKTFALLPERFIANVEKRTVVMHCRMEGTLKTESKWLSECIMIVELSEDYSQVVKITEFVDSARAMEMKDRHAPKDFV
jgi:hypothetical protein